jgi:Tol biopolymer transport system component
MIRTLFLVLLLAGSGTAQDSPYGSLTPRREPVLFAPGVISSGDHETHAEFTADGKTVYFLKNAPDFSFWTIFVSQFRNGKWSEPELAPFSGPWVNADPYITPDGRHFFFISNRPLDPRSTEPNDNLDIWVMDKQANGAWGTPRNPGEPVNSKGNEWYPRTAADGTLYFGSDRPGGLGGTDIYRCKFGDAKYQPAENLGEAINSKYNEYEPYIAPDQHYMIFMAARPGGLGGNDLWISYQRDGKWTPAKNLGAPFNSAGAEYAPKITPDGKYFLWSSTRSTIGSRKFTSLTAKQYLDVLHSPQNGLGDIYLIDVDALQLEK